MTEQERAPARSYRTPHTIGERVKRAAIEKGLAVEWNPLLDRPSERRPWIDALMDETYARLILTMDGSTTSFRKKVLGGDTGSKMPTSSLAGELRELDVRYTRARTHRQRFHVIRDGQALVETHKALPVVPLHKLIDNATGTPAEIAAHLGCTTRTVQRRLKQTGKARPPGRPKKRDTG